MKNHLTKISLFLVVLTVVLPATSRPANAQSTVGTAQDVLYSRDTYTYKIVDNHEIRADVYRHPGEEILPAIIWIHGGALIFGTRNWLPSEQLDAYIKAGFAVVSIDYRLAPETKLAAIIEDVKDAYTWLCAKGPELFKIDPDRIAVVGHSAGGYLTLMAGVSLKPRPDALVSFYGYGDITGPWYSQPDSFYNRSPSVSQKQAYLVVGDSTISSTPTQFSRQGRFQFYLYSRQQGLWPKKVSGHDPVSERTWYSEYEPLRNVTPSYPPTILLHGAKDTDVPFEQSILMAEELRRHGVDCEFITNPDWGHVFDGAGMEDPTVQAAFDRVLIFLEKHVR